MSAFDFSLFSKGGPMMFVLAPLGVALLVLFLERLLFLHRGQIRAKAFVDGIKNILAKRRLVEALTVCEETPGPVAAVVKAALLHADAPAEEMRYQVQEAAVIELPALERRLGSLAAVAQVAPLAGLLGTVLGMITTFVAFEKDYMSASALARGFWQALLSVAGSLMLAIPAHLAHHFLSGRVRAIVRDVEWSANEIMKYLQTEYRQAPGAGEAVAPEEGK
ncbi:MAG: MotA/TolQ/ExbB proton channel family protein [Verrucomicrobia bacterium]|nr:MotA/TolQ/ExbB proton channel family protein [Verrucomicrobiota bacterium]